LLPDQAFGLMMVAFPQEALPEVKTGVAKGGNTVGSVTSSASRMEAIGELDASH
jgi:hypothetical protein